MTTTYAPRPEIPPQRETGKREPGAHHVDWSLLSPQGRVLFYIALCPSCSVEEIALALGLTERSVWTIIRSLRDMDMVRFQRLQRRHRYSINLDAPLLAPSVEGLTLRDILGGLVENGQKQNVNCVRLDANGKRQYSA